MVLEKTGEGVGGCGSRQHTVSLVFVDPQLYAGGLERGNLLPIGYLSSDDGLVTVYLGMGVHEFFYVLYTLLHTLYLCFQLSLLVGFRYCCCFTKIVEKLLHPLHCRGV
jgi:hypothetical protein